MTSFESIPKVNQRARQAAWCWLAFILLSVIINGTIPFALGADVHAWVFSPLKTILYSLVIYGGVFLVLPLILTKGWSRVRQPGFLLPIIIAVLAITFWNNLRGIAIVAVLVIAYLHWRFDLSELGIHTQGWKGDLAGVLVVGLIYLVPVFVRPEPRAINLGAGLLSGLDRLFANPASTVEQLFYFGFLAERLSFKTGWWTAPLIGLMFTAHEMSNPEYWYEGMQFVLVFFGVTILTGIYWWRRSIVVLWLGRGLGSFLSGLFG